MGNYIDGYAVIQILVSSGIAQVSKVPCVLAFRGFFFANFRLLLENALHPRMKFFPSMVSATIATTPGCYLFSLAIQHLQLMGGRCIFGFSPKMPSNNGACSGCF
jgi:hypothetical protein